MMGTKEIPKTFFDEKVQKWSLEGIMLGIVSAVNAANLVNSGEYEIINRSAIDEVCF